MKYEVEYRRETTGAIFIEANSPKEAIELAEEVLANGEEFQSPFDADATDDWEVLSIDGVSVDDIENMSIDDRTRKEGAR